MYDRYNIPYCFILIESSTSLDLVSVIRNKIRKTDKVFEINSKVFALFCPFTEETKGGFKAAENILAYLENSFPSARFYMGLSCKGENDEHKDIVSCGIYALSKAKEFKENHIEDDNDIS